MPAQLVALNDGPSILLDKPILLLGRHPECDIQIDSRKISRRHCCIAQVSDYLVVRDLGSTNGVRINGIRVVEGQLDEGDELTIGSHRYRIAWSSEEPPPRRAAAAPAAMPAPPAAKPPQRATVLDDELLESSDEPVALPEPGASQFGLRYPEVEAAPPTPGELGLIVPDNIELLPNDSFHGLSGSPSHPGH